jgi:hypothetical protein
MSLGWRLNSHTRSAICNVGHYQCMARIQIFFINAPGATTCPATEGRAAVVTERQYKCLREWGYPHILATTPRPVFCLDSIPSKNRSGLHTCASSPQTNGSLRRTVRCTTRGAQKCTRLWYAAMDANTLCPLVTGTLVITSPVFVVFGDESGITSSRHASRVRMVPAGWYLSVSYIAMKGFSYYEPYGKIHVTNQP